MENLATSGAAVSALPRGRPLFALGVLLFFLGLLIYVVQFRLKHLVTPWHVPILATLGVLLMGASVWQRPGVWRIAGLALFGLVCGFEWFFLAAGSKSPVYTGPAQPGRKIPAFAGTRADGRMFGDSDLEQGVPTVLLFFRGRW
jgi:hypothetical protein